MYRLQQLSEASEDHVLQSQFCLLCACNVIHINALMLLSLFHITVVEFAVVERIMEKHTSTALVLYNKPLSVSALPPRPDALPLLSCEIDRHRLLFNYLPDSVTTDSFKKYLHRASPSRDNGSTSRIGRQPTITSVIYCTMQRGIAMAVFEQPYGKQI